MFLIPLFIVGGLIGFVSYKEGAKDPLYIFEQHKTQFLTSYFQGPKDNIEPVEPSKYTYAKPDHGHDHGIAIDIKEENDGVSRFILKAGDNVKFFIIPGFVPPMSAPMSSNHTTQKRINWAVKMAGETKFPVFFVTGGNVKPPATPYNEALEMKKLLMERHKVPDFLIAIDPYAQNTVTNLRNAGRFMLAHKIPEATIVTTYVQNNYIGFSIFESRSQKLLGYNVGKIEKIDERKSRFLPSSQVLQKSSQTVDP